MNRFPVTTSSTSVCKISLITNASYKVPYTVQSGQFLSTQAISDFARQFDHLAVHFNIDVLNPQNFHSTYFANPNLTGDGSWGGSMTMNQLQTILTAIDSAG